MLSADRTCSTFCSCGIAWTQGASSRVDGYTSGLKVRCCALIAATDDTASRAAPEYIVRRFALKFPRPSPALVASAGIDTVVLAPLENTS